MNFWFAWIFSLLFSHALQAEIFEGILGKVGDMREARMRIVDEFLPYNPIIVEIGGYEGENAKSQALAHPKGKVIVFEPNPQAFQKLLMNTAMCKNLTAYNLAINSYNGTAQLHLCSWKSGLQLEKGSSLLLDLLYGNLFIEGMVIEVPCVHFDDWCQENQIKRIDLLHLDIEGFELEVLKHSRKILSTVSVILITTNHSPFRFGTVQYPDLKSHLEFDGFQLISHWYNEGRQGEAIFIRQSIYDSIFR